MKSRKAVVWGVWAVVLVIWLLAGAFYLPLKKHPAISATPAAAIPAPAYVTISLNEKDGVITAGTTGSGLLVVRLGDGTYMATAK